MISQVHVCLVRTEYSANIGAAARAMANMGADRLILIDPKCRITNKTHQMAAGAQIQLKRITTYKTWEQFYKEEGEGLRLAFTRRGGKKRKIFPTKTILQKLKRQKSIKGRNLYLIFGPEADGLDVSDLAFVNYCCSLPVYGEFGSLNLAQAVLLALFIVREAFPPHKIPDQVKGTTPEAVQPFYFPDESIRNWLTAMGFNIQARRGSAYLTLKKLFLQNLPTQHELRVLEAVLQQNIRRLKEGKRSTLLTTENLANDLSDVTVKNI